MKRDEYVEVLKALGHFHAAVIRKANGSGFYAACECGYKSTTRLEMRQAVETVEHHRSKILKAARADGVSLTGFVGGST